MGTMTLEYTTVIELVERLQYMIPPIEFVKDKLIEMNQIKEANALLDAIHELEVAKSKIYEIDKVWGYPGAAFNRVFAEYLKNIYRRIDTVEQWLWERNYDDYSEMLKNISREIDSFIRYRIQREL